MLREESSRWRGRHRQHARARALPGLTAESIQASYIPTDDQRMNVMRAFVSEDAFEIHEMPNRGILIGNSCSAKNVPRLPCTLQGHPNIVSFGQRYLRGTRFARLHQARKTERQ